MAAVFRGLELLDSAIGYAVASAELAAPRLLSHPTPCAAWDLAALLGHVSDSADALREAICAGRVGSGGTPREADPARQLRERLAALLAATAATAATVAYPPPRRPVAIGDRELTASMVILAGAMEIAVHGRSRRTWPPSCSRPRRCWSPRTSGRGCSPARCRYAGRPLPATSWSHFSAAGRCAASSAGPPGLHR
jgi:hypothetical protein